MPMKTRSLTYFFNLQFKQVQRHARTYGHTTHLGDVCRMQNDNIEGDIYKGDILYIWNEVYEYNTDDYIGVPRSGLIDNKGAQKVFKCKIWPILTVNCATVWRNTS